MLINRRQRGRLRKGIDRPEMGAPLQRDAGQLGGNLQCVGEVPGAAADVEVEGANPGGQRAGPAYGRVVLAGLLDYLPAGRDGDGVVVDGHVGGCEGSDGRIGEVGGGQDK